eukprot:2670695-Pyramimonas_sp.AAC.1
MIALICVRLIAHVSCDPKPANPAISIHDHAPIVGSFGLLQLPGKPRQGTTSGLGGQTLTD